MPSSNSTSKAKSRSQPAPTFICQIPLRVIRAHARILSLRLEAARQVDNACLGEALCRARLVRERQRAFWAHLDGYVAQKLGSRAFAAANAWLLRQRGRPRCKGCRQLDTVEGKAHHAGIRWRDDHVEWFGPNLPALIDTDDPVIPYALGCRVKYVRLVRRKLGGRDRFWAQLACEGIPYRKPKRKTGDGEVGVDIGPSTVAVVGEGTALLIPFCDEVVRSHRTIRRLQRKLDRQRRANNPEYDLPGGRVKPGPKTWVESTRQCRIQDQLAERLRRESAHRKTRHGRLANRVLALGRVIKTEQLSCRALQRQYGRSVSARVPGMFLSILRRKAESAGGRVIEFPTRTTTLSQVCHGCGAIKKKPRSQRIHACECGVEMQRDLYSAFLAWCGGEDNCLHADTAREALVGCGTAPAGGVEQCEPTCEWKGVAFVLLWGCAPESERVARGRGNSQGRGPGCCSASARRCREPGRGGGDVS